MNRKILLTIGASAFAIYALMRSQPFIFGQLTPNGSPPRGCDPYGCGYFGASRDNGTRLHNGVDIDASPGTLVLSPIDGFVSRVDVRPYPNENYRGIEITGEGRFAGLVVIIMYMQPNVALGTVVRRGQVLGTTQNITARYGPSMRNHLHVEVRDGSGAILDPMQFMQ